MPRALLPRLAPLGVDGSAAVAAAEAIPNLRSRLNRWIRNWNQASPHRLSLTPTRLAQLGDSPAPAESPVGTPHVGRDGGNDDGADGGGGFEPGRRRWGEVGVICGSALSIGPFGWGWKLDGFAADRAVAQPRLG